MESISLYTLTQKLQATIRSQFDRPVWIRAEISDLKENYNGHCYLELIEKDQKTDQIIAKMRASIWANTYAVLRPYFEESTGTKLKSGIQVLVSAVVDYHGMYGLGLTIRDIDPSFTLGDLAARRLQVLKQLETDGVIDMNKELSLPILPRRIAIISSATAAGYEDFCNQLHSDENHYAFYTKLFPAVMQGDQAAISIISALERVFEYSGHFDLVLIIRGGGATTDLSCFDDYELSLHCAQFPLPVISGIGHQRDFSIVDRVAFRSVKTPTAAAAFLIEKMAEAEFRSTDPFNEIVDKVSGLIRDEKNRNSELRWRLKQALVSKTSHKKIHLENSRTRLSAALSLMRQKQITRMQRIDAYKSALRQQWKLILMRESQRLSLLERGIEPHSPKFLIAHGYTLTTLNGKRLSTVKEVKKGDRISTWLHDGEIKSTVE